MIHNQRRRILTNHFPGIFFWRDVEIFDVPGEYINADIPEDKIFLIKIEGEFVDIMYKLNPKHKINVHV